MTDRVKNVLLIVLSITALALGGSALAGAASGGSGSNSGDGSSSSRPDRPAAGMPPQRPDETLLTGDTAAKVRAAALAEVSGGTIERVETDADGHAAYEAHMTRSDGSRVTVYVNKSFEVVSTENGP
ncbi:MAG TPA: hypothetical protein VH420_02300 [Gaiellaceae bacterium]|jgi:hypothetical protein